MCKKIFSYTLLLLIISLSSCAVEQEVTFLSSGEIKYNMSLDAREFMLLSSQDKENIKGEKMDTIISIVKMLEEEYNEMLEDNPELKQDYENIAPFYLHLKRDTYEKEFTMSVYGTFKDDEAFNTASESMNKLFKHSSEVKKQANGLAINGIFANAAIFSWDGKTMKRRNQKVENIEDKDGEADSDTFSDISNYLFGGMITVKYNFPSKVKSVSDPEALLSQDGKSVILKYSGNVLTTEVEDANIQVELE